MDQHSPCKGLLISVGGSPNPVAYSINAHKPEKLLFFASRESRGEIETKVRPLTTHRWQDQEVITTPNHEDLTQCMEVLVEKLPRRLEVLGLTISDLVVDYTGGTKTMSAALVLATVNQPVRYSYIGGTVRTKEGLGVVLDGSEAILLNPNPWDVLAVEARREVARQINAGRFNEAGRVAAHAADKVGDRWRAYFSAVVDLCEAYRRWRAFDYTGAVHLLRRARAELLQYAQAANDSSLLTFLDGVGLDLTCLEQLAQASRTLQGGGRIETESADVLIHDLVRNAVATMRLDDRAEDAVSRLYSALEKIGKATLLKHGIDNSAAKAEQIPTSLREEYVSRYSTDTDGRLQFGLFPSYVLLDALGDPLGGRFRAVEQQLRTLLDVRNSALLVHGWKPVKANVFEDMLCILLDFLGISRESIPPYPCCAMPVDPLSK